MANPYERMKAAWELPDGRLALHRVVEAMAAEGVTRDELDEGLSHLLDDVRKEGVDEDTEEVINSVGDRIHGWCHVSRHIKFPESTLPTIVEIAKLPRWARVAFAARCARRVLPIFTPEWDAAHPWYGRPELDEATIRKAVTLAEQYACGRRDSITNADVVAHSADRVARRAQTTQLTIASEVAFSAAHSAHATTNAGLKVDNHTIAHTVAAAQSSLNAVSAFGAARNIDLTSMSTYAIRADFDTLERCSAESKWNDDSQVLPSVFGAMWPFPEGPPPGWPVELLPQPLLDQVAQLEIDPLIDVNFADGEFSADEMQLFLDYLAATYRDVGGTGLKVVEGQTLIESEAEVLR